MRRKEREGDREHLSVLETGNIIWINPRELLGDNFAALIVNREMYQRMAKKFSPGLFEPIQVARVLTYGPEGEVEKILVVDGMTRTKYAADQGFLQIKARDVTTDLIENPEVVPSEERFKDKPVLTVTEYLRAVVPPTKVHQEIAPYRIAAHIINSWRALVGEKVVSRIPVIAALLPSVRHDRLLEEVELEARVGLQRGLETINSVIRESNLWVHEVTRSALILLATGSEVIGGRIEALNQVEKLLQLEDFDKKLVAAFPKEGEREHIRIQVARFLYEELRKGGSDVKVQYLDLVHQIFKDPYLNLDQIADVLTSKDPWEVHKNIRKERNKELVLSEYKRSQGREELLESELFFIGLLGEKETLETDSDRIVATIVDLTKLRSEVLTLRNSLENNMEDLVKRGVNPVTIEEGLTSIKEAVEVLTTRRSIYTVTEAMNGLRKMKTKLEQEITNQINTHRVRNIVLEMCGQARMDFVYYLLRHCDPRSEAQIKASLASLNRLDPLLQREVTLGLTDIKTAQKRQQDKARVSPKVSPERPVELTEAKKRELVGEFLSIVDGVHGALNKLNVSSISKLPEALPSESLKKLDQVIADLNYAKLLHEEFLRERKVEEIEKRKKIQTQVAVDTEEAQKDTRTKR